MLDGGDEVGSLVGSEVDANSSSSGRNTSGAGSTSSTRSNGTNGSIGPGQGLGLGPGVGVGQPANKLQSFLKAASVTQKFKTQLAGLMSVIEGTTVQYVRCIKPNSVKSAEFFDRKMVVEQLRCAGTVPILTHLINIFKTHHHSLYPPPPLSTIRLTQTIATPSNPPYRYPQA